MVYRHALSHGAAIVSDALEPTIGALKAVVHNDRNAVCVGFASDALARLANLGPKGETPPLIRELRENLLTIFKASPAHSWDSLTRAGMNASDLSELGLAQ